VNDIRNVRLSDAEIDKTTDKVMTASGILKRNTECEAPWECPQSGDQ
jgi:hypothetical protein